MGALPGRQHPAGYGAVPPPLPPFPPAGPTAQPIQPAATAPQAQQPVKDVGSLLAMLVSTAFILSSLKVANRLT